jgi:deoxyribodipyrimidine photo-lyase
VRACLRAAMLNSNMTKVEGSGVSGVGRWIQEIAWRDFYTEILASFPRVSMGRPYLEKFSTVVWEDHQVPEGTAVGPAGDNRDGENLQRWKAGQTGVPIVDATMRCLNEMGWVHNRARMITAMYLIKDLMIDWRVGERVKILSFIDKCLD